MEEILTMIQTIGFPITTSLLLGWYVWKTSQDTRTDFLSRENRLIDTTNKMSEALNKSADVIEETSLHHAEMLTRLNIVEQKVDRVEGTVSVIRDKVISKD